MTSNPSTSRTERVRLRIKGIELNPMVSNYAVGAKLLMGDEEFEIPRKKAGDELTWSNMIIRNPARSAELTLELYERHTLGRHKFFSRPYAISNLVGQDEAALEFPEAWSAKLVLLTENTAEQSHDEALRQLKDAELAPSALEKLSKARDILENILDFGGAVAELHPTAKMVFSISTLVWEKLKEQDQLKSDVEGLINGLTGIGRLAQEVRKHSRMEQLQETIEELLVLLDDVLMYVLERHSTNSAVRVLRYLVDSSNEEEARALLDRFKVLQEEFDSAVGVDTHTKVHKFGMDWRLKQLLPVQSARFDTDRACQEGTRSLIISRIISWTERREIAALESGGMLWIHGQAGMGKSSIAASVCAQLSEKQKLAASFFCKRDDRDLHDPLRLINTLAHGLASQCSEYAMELAAEIENDRESCITNNLPARYEGLFRKPLQRIKTPPSRSWIILVDALDECSTQGSRHNLMKLLWNMSQLVPWLKVVVTSRPDTDIKSFFEGLGNANLVTFDVHDFDASDDIRAYFVKEFSQIAGKHAWPESGIDQLCTKAEGIFIWATTVKRYIKASIGSTRPRLQAVLQDQGSENQVSKHQAKLSALDELYTRVIQDGMRQAEDDAKETFLQCLGVIVAASTRQPLPLSDLKILLLGKVDNWALDEVVERLGAVLRIDDQKGGAIRFYHPSFADYAASRSRSGEFCVDLDERNAEMALGCLGVLMKELKFNICGLETSHLLNSQVSNLSERVGRISSQLKYSCAYWISHVVDTPKKSLKHEIETLLSGPRVLYWLEMLSLLKLVDETPTNLLELRAWLPDDSPSLAAYVYDVYRFTLAFHDVISMSVPHIYISAFALAPKSAEIVQRLRNHFPNTVKVARNGDKAWPGWLRTFDHPRGVSSLAISPDSQLLATGSIDNTIRIWNVRTGNLVGDPLTGHSGTVTSLAFSPDGYQLVSGSQDSTLRVWDTRTYKLVGQPLAGHSNRVACGIFSPKGHRIASASLDLTIRIWDAESRRLVGEPLVGHSDCVTSLAFSRSGELLVSGSRDKTLRIWIANTGVLLGAPLTGHTGWVTSVAFSPHNDWIVSGSKDRSLRVWDGKTCTPIGEPLVEHGGVVAAVSFSPDGKKVVSSSGDRTVRVWDIGTRKTIGRPLVGHSEHVTCVAFSSSYGHIFSGSKDTSVRMWDVKASVEVEQWAPRHIRGLWSLAFSPDGKTILHGSNQGAYFWDSETGTKLDGPPIRRQGMVRSVAWSSDGSDIATGGDKTIQIVNVKSKRRGGKPLAGHDGKVTSVAFSPDCARLVSGSDDCTVRMWDVKTRAPIGRPLVGHSKCVTAVAFSGRQDRVVSSSEDGTIRMWDGRTGEPVGEPLALHSAAVNSVAISSDGRRIVSGSSDKTLRLWDAETGKPIGDPFVGHKDSVSAVAFSPDGSRVASGSCDNTLRMWDSKTGNPIGLPFRLHSNQVTSVAFSPSGDRILSGSLDETVRTWSITSEHPGPNLKAFPPWPPSTFGLPPHPNHPGWTTFDSKSHLLWLPAHYRRKYDHRAILTISVDRSKRTIWLDFSKFVHGDSWTSVASDGVRENLV